MKIMCSSWEKEQLINLISESVKSCRENCPFYKKCNYDCDETWENEVNWEIK